MSKPKRIASVERRVARAVREARARVLRRMITDEATIDREMRSTADALRLALRPEGLRSRDVERIVLREMDAAAERVTRVAEGGVRHAAGEGAALDRATFDAAFGAARAERSGFRFAATREADAAAARVIRGELLADRVKLSSRMWANARTASRAMTAEIRTSLRTGESVVAAAERVIRAADPVTRLPAYVTELRDAVRRDVSGRELRRVVASHARSVEALGAGASREASALSIRSASKDFVRRAQRAGADEIDGLVERWAYDRARYQARLVTRTETMRALRTAYETASAAKPYVPGVRWTISPQHPRPDVCDMLAGVDMHGLGPGGYPGDEAPAIPHPACLCTTIAIVDERYFARETARRNGTPEPPKPWESGTNESPAQWMAQQPAAQRLAILGPGRARQFDRSPTSVLRSDATIATLHAAQGKPPPTRSVGEPMRIRQTTVGARELRRRPARG